jgi:multidrug efflux pump subunit AcrB
MADEPKQASESESRGQEESPPVLDEKHLGIAGRMTRSFINSPVTPLLMLGALGIGLLGLLFTPRQEDPKISVPMVDIYVQYPGASSEQVASLVTDPLDRIMSEIPGVRHVYSASQRGSALVTVRFLVGEDLGQSIVKVHDKLQSNLDKIPPGVSMPLVKPVGIDDVPIVTVTLWSKDVDDASLRTLGLDVLQHLNEVPGTGKGFVVGGRSEQIRVEVLPERLSGFGISLDQVANTIRTANAEQKAGSVESGDTAFNVYTGAFLRNADEIARLVVGTRHGSPIYVGDVARVFQAPEETDKMVTYYTGPALQDPVSADGEPAVTIAIAKKIGTNGVTIANQIIEKLNSLKGQLIPDNVHATITRNYGETANHKVNELLSALFEAAIAVSILCLIGLGARAAFVVITVIPIVILVTVWSAWVLDYTIDRVSLFALVFAIGILVDDATVVVENIFRRWLAAGKTTVEVAVDAVREVGNPTILATLTIISALLPMGFVSGLMGPYMRPIPVLGSSAMFFSLLAAFLFTPWFAMRVRPSNVKALAKAERREEKTRSRILRFYRPLMKPLIENRALAWLFLLVLIGITIFSCAMFYTKAVPVKMLPFDNKPEFDVVINMPEGTALPVTANVAARLAQELRTIPEVTALQSYVGTASPFNFNGMVRHYYLRRQPWEADIQVMLTDKEQRERGSHAIAVAARHLLGDKIKREPDLKDLGVRIQVVEMPPGPPVLQTVVAEIYGPNADTRRQVARDMTRMFEKVDNIVDVDNYMAHPYHYWTFEVDTEKAVRRGISVDTINRNLAMALGGYQLGDVKRGVVLEPTYIVIQVPLASRSQVSRLGNMPIVGSTGESVPLSELGRFVRVPADPIIYHQDLRPVEYVTGEMEGRLGAPIYGMFGVEDLLKNYTAPDGVKITGMPWGLIGPPATDAKSGFEWGGEWTVTYETFRDMGMAFMAALVLIYGLIVWEFKNFKLGALIMAPLPLTLIGIIPGHWITGAEFTATSMIGLIALSGIIVRNSILLVEFVKNEVAENKPIREAVIAAGATRMRPIIITSLTTMVGSGMLITDPIFQGMAVSLLFGAAVATVLTLVAIPLGCITARKQFYLLTGTMPAEETAGEAAPEQASRSTPAASSSKPSLAMRIWPKVAAVLIWTFYILRTILLFIWMGIQKLWRMLVPIKPSGPSTPPSSPGARGGGTPPQTSPGSGGGHSAHPSAATAQPNLHPIANIPHVAEAAAASDSVAAEAMKVQPGQPRAGAPSSAREESAPLTLEAAEDKPTHSPSSPLQVPPSARSESEIGAGSASVEAEPSKPEPVVPEERVPASAEPFAGQTEEVETGIVDEEIRNPAPPVQEASASGSAEPASTAAKEVKQESRVRTPVVRKGKKRTGRKKRPAAARAAKKADADVTAAPAEQKSKAQATKAPPSRAGKRPGQSPTSAEVRTTSPEESKRNGKRQ